MNEADWWDAFDFSSCFLESVVMVVPTAFLLLVSPYWLWSLSRRKRGSPPASKLYVSKQAAYLMLALLFLVEAADAIIGTSAGRAAGVKVFSPAALFGGVALGLVVLSMEHGRGIRTSRVLGGFWLLSLISCSVRFRSLILIAEQEDWSGDALDPLRYAYFGVQFCLTILACMLTLLKEPPLLPESPRACPEQSSNLLSLLTFQWMSGLMLRGYRAPLVDDDLWALNPEDQAPTLAKKFAAAWEQMGQRTGCCGGGNWRLIRTFSKAFGPLMYQAGFFKLCQDLLNFAQPELLGAVITFVECQTDDGCGDQEATYMGWVWAILMFTVATTQSIILQQYFHRVFRTGMRLRSATMTAVYSKSLRLSAAARQSSTSGEIINLMSVDAQRFMDVVTYMHMLWSAPLQIALSLFFLYRQLGVAVFAGLGVMLMLIPINAFIAKTERAYSVKVMKKKDERVKQMNEVFNGIKVAKVYAWERAFQQLVETIREAELRLLRRAAVCRAWSRFSWTIAPFMVSVITFAVYVNLKDADGNFNQLNASKAFMSLALFNLLRFPLAMLPMLITALVQASISVRRLTDFLELPEKDSSAVQTLPPPGQQGARSQVAASIDGGMFAWSTAQGYDTPPDLQRINLTVPAGQLCAVVGRVGCGKSSLVSAILGDMQRMSGTVRTVSSVAYVPQEAWIQNATVRANIIFNREFDAELYQRVIFACALRSDLAMLPGGDMTEIGEKGINLSGGQKQRISLARAVYARADLYLLDDPLSAVDTHVGKHIFKHVIGPTGMLAGATRVFVTHAIQYLPKCGSIVTMANGTIVESGPYAELMAKRGPFAAFIDEFGAEEEEEDDEGESEGGADGAPAPLLSLLPPPRAASRGAGGAVGDPAIVARRDGALSPMSLQDGDDERKGDRAPLLGGLIRKRKGGRESPAAAGTQLIERERVEKGEVLRDIYLKYFRALGLPSVLVIVLLYLSAYSMQLGSNFWLARWSQDEDLIGNSTTESPADQKARTDLYVGIYGALGVGYATFVLICSLVLAFAAIRASASTHHKMLGNVLRAPMSFFDTTPMGRIVNRFGQDVYAIDELVPQKLSSMLECMMQVLSTIIAICINAVFFTIAIVPMGVVFFFVQRYYIPTARQLKRLESVSRSPIYAHFSETLAGVPSIRAYGATHLFRMEHENKVDYNLQAYYPSVASNRWLAMRLEFLGNSIIFFTALFIIIDSLQAEPSIRPGNAGLALTYAMSVTQTLNWMVRMAAELETNIVAVERVDEYTKIATERPPILPYRPPYSWPQSGRIHISGLSVRYREGLDLVLRNINCVVQSGEKIGVVGRTGAGKSSLMVALFRVVEPAAGTIIIDNEDITKIGLDDLRSKITIMPQDAVLFVGTVRTNIDPFAAYDDATLWDALETSHLKDRIQALEGGLDAEVSEGGSNFSAGERQLICLTRAVLRKSKILVLDEATASCDIETDNLVQRTIRTVFADCTVLTIAHRINTIMDNDRIMVLDKGEIAELDSPRQLLAQKNGIFFGMAKSSGLVDDDGNLISGASADA